HRFKSCPRNQTKQPASRGLFCFLLQAPAILTAISIPKQAKPTPPDTKQPAQRRPFRSSQAVLRL
ncbi:hypothetical protein, partial [Mesorhizobium sp. M2D.F.Ca.ET.140.01.1.1]|uniref:hypothetical protein n=1 Tax=Mesorhizobium sp. M2D.F.Ca.ET.140.01.1.1 TaxID=2496664 RepID=UPI001AECDF5A